MSQHQLSCNGLQNHLVKQIVYDKYANKPPFGMKLSIRRNSQTIWRDNGI